MAPDLAVLCAIPLTEAEWLRPGRGVPSSDFVRYAARKFDRDAAAAWHFFRSEAQFIARKLDAIAARGVTVRQRATAADLRAAAAAHRDIVVVAHWKSEVLLHEDLLDAAALRAIAAGLGLDTEDLGGEPDELARLRRALNRFIDAPAPATALPQDALPQDALPQDALHGRIARRQYLNQFSALMPGNLLELWDEMVDAATFSALFPVAFSGTVLTLVCTSDHLMEHFRRAHLPAATSLSSRNEVRIGLSLAKLDAALALMQQAPYPLAQAWRMAGDMIDSIARRTP